MIRRWWLWWAVLANIHYKYTKTFGDNQEKTQLFCHWEAVFYI